MAESWPKFAFAGDWDEQGQTFDTATPGYQYRINMKVPIFTSGRLRAERKSAALAEQRAQKQLAQERNQVTEQVSDWQVELQAALHQVELGRQEVQMANEEVTLSQGRVRLASPTTLKSLRRRIRSPARTTRRSARCSATTSRVRSLPVLWAARNMPTHTPNSLHFQERRMS